MDRSSYRAQRQWPDAWLRVRLRDRWYRPLYTTLFCVPLLVACGSRLTPERDLTCHMTVDTGFLYVIDNGWHTAIGFDAVDLTGGLATFKTIFPHARAVVFGYGKRTFMTARPQTISEYIMGPVPGPAVIEAVGLTVSPELAYGQQHVSRLRLPRQDIEAAVSWVANDLADDPQGQPRLVGFEDGKRGAFYVARDRYSMLHTCNRWSADLLRKAGVPLEPAGVVLSGQLIRRLNQAAIQCPSDQPPAVIISRAADDHQSILHSAPPE
ncbi:Hypothetical protein GbCGDNIH2_0894 [Granulibacter bethesdensis]|nr:Hypothetical protein GbCGDNIH2_0894 [Granulibacter bethesdensis]